MNRYHIVYSFKHEGNTVTRYASMIRAASAQEAVDKFRDDWFRTGAMSGMISLRPAPITVERVEVQTVVDAKEWT